MELSLVFTSKIDEVISRYPVSKRSAALPLLHLFQEEFGFISPEAVVWIAKRLDLQPINVYELVTFYPMFRQKPAGRYHFRVCRTLSCAMAGSYTLHETIARLTGIPLPDTSHDPHPPGQNGDRSDFHDPVHVSPDGKFSIEFVECLASCGTAPVCLLNDSFHENVSEEKAAELIASCH